jgi:hypothetical protein
MVRVLDIEARSEELVCGAIGTELAATGSIRVGEITSSAGYVTFHVVSTRSPRRRFQGHQLNRSTGDILLSNG